MLDIVLSAGDLLSHKIDFLYVSYVLMGKDIDANVNKKIRISDIRSSLKQ